MPKLSASRHASIDARLAVSLAAGRSHAQAAEDSGCSERHVLDRVKDMAFRAEVAAVRTRTIDLAVGGLAQAASEAVATLRGLLKTAESDAAKVSAARAILTALVTIQTHAELARRVAELEERMEVQDA